MTDIQSELRNKLFSKGVNLKLGSKQTCVPPPSPQRASPKAFLEGGGVSVLACHILRSVDCC